MNQKESDLLQFENELLNTRQHLNSLIHEYVGEDQNPRNAVIWQDKIYYFETELKYLNNQLQMLKNMPYQTSQAESLQSDPAVLQETPGRPVNAARIFPVNTSAVPPVNAKAASPVNTSGKLPVQTAASHARKPKDSRDYEKLFGKNFMGVFASVLIFISLIIFATLMLPYLTDTIKLIGLYVISFAILLAGYIPAQRKKSNKFYTILIACGIGSLYISLLLSNLYFKVIGDITLYILILVWAVLIKYLPGLKNMVCHIIGQSGILIATILGVALCVQDVDAAKFLVLTVFYFIAAFVFSGRKQENHALNLCNHICKALNLIALTIGLTYMDQTNLRVINIAILMLYLLLEFYFSYKEEYSSGPAFQLLTITYSVILVWLFHLSDLFPENSTYAFMYIAAIALLFYVYKKQATYEIISEVFFFGMIYLGCHKYPFIHDHLYAYLTVIPAMIYGKMRNKERYLYTGLILTAELLILTFSSKDHYVDYLFMTAAVYLTFLFICRTMTKNDFRIFGYVLLSLVLTFLVHDSTFQFLSNYNAEHLGMISNISEKAWLIPFFILALIHLALNVLSYFGTEKPIEYTMYVVNAILMIAGCAAIRCHSWKLASIMIAALLFLINSRRLLSRNQNVGYYIAFKYTVFMLFVLSSYDATNYVISICLLLFAIASIIIGFYRSAASFRLYGLVLSMISIVKLIMIDIQYDSTLENAFSFLISGVLCFAISFIYHKIDTNLKNHTKASITHENNDVNS